MPGVSRGKGWATWLDAAFAIGFAAYWAVSVTPVVREERLPYDGFRDIAAALDIQLAGRWRDPAYAAETPWHPPLGPWIAAFIASALRTTPDNVYLWSQLLINWMIPAGLYLVVRLAWGPVEGLLGTIAFLFAMPWWREYIVMHLASWQALIGGWIAILLAAWAFRGESPVRPILAGAFLGLAAFFHPVVPGHLACMLILNACWERVARRSGGDDAPLKDRTRTSLILLGTAAVIGVPLVCLYAHGPVLNRLPGEFIDLRLRSLYWAGLDGNPWLWGCGIVGIAAAARRPAWASRLLICGLIVTVAGQLLGYLRLFGVKGFPVCVPHQFQMHFQLLFSVCIGLGAVTIVGAIVKRVAAPAAGRFPALVLIAAAAALTGWRGLLAAPETYRRMPPRSVCYPPWLNDAGDWIRENTSPDDVFFLSPELAYVWLGPATARKVWLAPAGHSNPRVDWLARRAVADRLTQTESSDEFQRRAVAAGIDYCVITVGTGITEHSAPSRFAGDWVPRFLQRMDPQALNNLPQMSVAYLDERGVMILRTSTPAGVR